MQGKPGWPAKVEGVLLLVNPPFASLFRPNLGLSLLKACLRRDGHESRILYADHDLAESFGIFDYSWVHEDYEALTGEWMFSGFVRTSGGWDQGYLDLMVQRGTYRPDQTERVLQAVKRLGTYVKRVVRQILALRPKVVGCSSTFQQNNAALAILRELKRQAPEVVTVMGGANLEGEPGESVLSVFDWVDYVVSGEAEGCISRFYELCLEHGAAIPEELLPAEVGRRGRPPIRGKVAEMDALPYPDFEDYFASVARFPDILPSLTLEGSRGCWWGQVKHCTFCGLNGSGMNYRAKSAERMLDEIQTLTARHPVPLIQMVDNIIAPKHLKDLLPALAGTDLRFFWEVKANLKGSHFELLREAGVHWVQPGIESFSDNVLNLMRKGQRAIQNVFVLKAARENGIRLSWNLLLRHPGETIEDVVEQRELAHSLMHLQPPQACCEVRPDRFSPLFTEAVDLEPYEVYSYIYELGSQELRRMAYLFRLGPQTRLNEARYSTRIEALVQKVEAWNAAWKVPGRRTLHFENGGVRDRRWPGQDLLHELSESEVGLLQGCSQPTRLADLGSPDVSRLLDLRLCYRDETHLLSLVLSKPSDQLPAIDCLSMGVG